MKKLLFITLLSLSFSASAQQWLCVTEHMTGFYMNEKTGDWEPATFLTKPKYVVSNTPQVGKNNYKVKELGTELEFSDCQDYVNKQGEIFINCKNKFGSAFLFNRGRNRFQFSNVIGGFVYPYLRDKTPFMSIGLCSSF